MGKSKIVFRLTAANRVACPAGIAFGEEHIIPDNPKNKKPPFREAFILQAENILRY